MKALTVSFSETSKHVLTSRVVPSFQRLTSLNISGVGDVLLLVPLG